MKTLFEEYLNQVISEAIASPNKNIIRKAQAIRNTTIDHKEMYDFLDESLKEIQSLIEKKNELFRKKFKMSKEDAQEFNDNLIDYSLVDWKKDPEWVIGVARGIAK